MAFNLWSGLLLHMSVGGDLLFQQIFLIEKKNDGKHNNEQIKRDVSRLIQVLHLFR